jgi:hypothetical protein
MSHFIKDRGYNPSIVFILAFAFLNIIFFLIPFIFFYEAFAEPHYWKNRWRLHRLLNRGLVKVKFDKRSSIFGDQIKAYDIIIENEEYSLWIWNGSEMTLDGPMDYSSYSKTDRNYIGLFKGSIITRWLNRIAVKKLTKLSENSAHEHHDEMTTI